MSINLVFAKVAGIPGTMSALCERRQPAHKDDYDVIAAAVAHGNNI